MYDQVNYDNMQNSCYFIKGHLVWQKCWFNCRFISQAVICHSVKLLCICANFFFFFKFYVYLEWTQKYSVTLLDKIEASDIPVFCFRSEEKETSTVQAQSSEEGKLKLLIRSCQSTTESTLLIIIWCDNINRCIEITQVKTILA